MCFHRTKLHSQMLQNSSVAYRTGTRSYLNQVSSCVTAGDLLGYNKFLGAVSLVVKDAAVQPSSPAPGHKLEAEASTVDHVPVLLVASPAPEPATLTPTAPTPISKPNPTSKSSIWPKSTSLLRPFKKSSFSSNALSSSSTHSLTPTPSFSTPTRRHHIVFSRFNSSQPRLEKQDGTGLPKHSINTVR
jgi:hypothetical protein